MANKKVFNPLGMPFDTVRDDIADLTTRNASDVVNTPAGDIVAINVQTAINELDTEKVPYTGGTGNVDIGDFELRAQTLESDVATGTAPFTIASTTVNTNLNADLLDGLHDTGYTKTTAGQTINVATAAELTAALALLAAAPSLLGTVTLQITADITGNFTIPALLYNGFELVIQGVLSEQLDDIATGGVDSTYGVGGVKGYAEKTTGAWAVNAYQHMLLMNPLGQYTPISGNTATRISHPTSSTYFTKFINTHSIKVYGWAYIITSATANTFVLDKFARVKFKNIKITNTVGVTLYGNTCQITTENCYITGSNISFGTINILAYSRLISNSSIIRSEAGLITRIESNSDVFCNLGSGTILYLAVTAGYKSALFLFQGATANLNHGVLIDGLNKTAGGLGVWALDVSSAIVSWAYIENWDTGLRAQRIGEIVAGTTPTFTNNNTNKNPAAASDPSYIS